MRKISKTDLIDELSLERDLALQAKHNFPDPELDKLISGFVRYLNDQIKRINNNLPPWDI